MTVILAASIIASTAFVAWKMAMDRKTLFGLLVMLTGDVVALFTSQAGCYLGFSLVIGACVGVVIDELFIRPRKQAS